MLNRKLIFKSSQCRAWHLVLTVVVMGLTMRLALGNLDVAPPHSPSMAYHYLANAKPLPVHRSFPSLQAPECLADPQDLPGIEFVPLDLNGSVPGPLLTDILKRYRPDATAIHADDLRDTLPPGQSPRMIVILPKDEQPVF